MDSAPGNHEQAVDTVTVRYWASVRAAAGMPEELLTVPGSLTLAELLQLVLAAHDHSGALSRVLAVCSVMVDGRQLRTGDPGRQVIIPGQVVEFLPPFAGG